MDLLSRWLRPKTDSAPVPGDSPSDSAVSAPALAPIPHAVAATAPPIAISAERLRGLFPVRNLNEEEIEAFAVDRCSEAYGAGSVLFERDKEANCVFYLLEGEVQMDMGDWSSYRIAAHSAKANFPLCSSKRYSATATALTDVQVIRVSPSIMTRKFVHVAEPKSAFEACDEQLPDTLRRSRLYLAFCENYRQDEVRVPTMPDVAIKLRNAIAEQSDISEIVRIVQMDQAIAAKLVHVANSPLYLPTSPITSLQQAVIRIGLQATRNLVVSYTLRQVFYCRDPFINKCLMQQWHSSIYLSALCYVLAGEIGSVSREEALLAGLICDIGAVPFLYFAENFPREFWKEEELAGLLPWVKGPIGAYVLNGWQFPDEIAQLPLTSEYWSLDDGPNLTVTDVVILSKLHAAIGTPRMAEVPAINSVPACGKLADRELTPEHSLAVLHKAKDKIIQALSMFDA